MRLDKAVLKALKASGRPLSEEEIGEGVRSRGVDVRRLAPVLDQLVAAGRVMRAANGRYAVAQQRNVLVGRLSMNRRGYGFVSTPAGDVYVGRKDLAGAMHKDTVAVHVEEKRGHARMSGRVVEIVDRGLAIVVGYYERHGRMGLVTPTDPRITSDIVVDLSSAEGNTAGREPEHGEVVVVRILRYPTSRDAAQGVIEEILGRPDEPGVDIEIIIREHGLATEFPPEALAEASRLSGAVDAHSLEGREDLRELFTVTIDPVDARDFDDAVSVERTADGYRMWVHIADVSHYVPWDGEVDREARQRATSVYLVDRVLPMLPEQLSNQICSLKPDEDRLTFTVEMELDRNAAIVSHRLTPSVIRSDRRLDYDTVDRWLAGAEEWPDEDTKRVIGDFKRVAELIGKRRVARGGLDFETVEAKVLLAEGGVPTEVVLRKRTVATNMIEEAMILANEVVARHMADAAAPMVFRIHEDPDPEALTQVATILKEFDYPMKDIHGASPQTFQRIVAFAHDRPEALLINSLLLRSLQRARYVDYLDKHFGLASDAYTHFTSPIRRYPDLIVHRLLRAQLSGTLDEGPTAEMAAELGWLAEHASVMEREAEWAEDDSVRVKLTELMAAHIGEEFDGIITGVATFGMFVQLENTAEGLVHVQAMADDYYRYDAERFMLHGENNGRIYRLGQRARVRITEANIAQRRLEFELA